MRGRRPGSLCQAGVIWIHAHTPWKNFIHSCGSVRALIPGFIAAGFDILNPVQCSAADMDPASLKREFGERLTFWGGWRRHAAHAALWHEVRERIRIFAPGGGFVFNTIHNVQPQTPVDNVLALYETVHDSGRYPL